MDKFSNCAHCPYAIDSRTCMSPDGKCPDFCTTVQQKQLVEKAKSVMESDPEIMRFAYMAGIQEGDGYAPSPYDPSKRMPVKPRIQEVIEFCQKMGFKKLGLAFCAGLQKEASQLSFILESHGFEVVSVVCKVGCVDKSFLGFAEEQKMKPGQDSMCNPVAQAMVLNDAETQFNLMLGLCVGHDSMFMKFAEAPTTVIAVKDRLLGHNPLAALYAGYYAYLKK